MKMQDLISLRKSIVATMVLGIAFSYSIVGQEVESLILNEVQKLRAADATEDDDLGLSVSMFENIIVASAGGKRSASGEFTGAAYVFERDLSDGQWKQTAKLEAADGVSRARFGAPVSVFGNTIFIGAPSDSSSGRTGAGSIYVFEKNASTNKWGQTAKLEPADAEAFDHFGVSISIAGELVVVGATHEDPPPSTNRDSFFYIFEKNSTTGQWEQIQKIIDDFEEIRVALSGEIILVGDFDTFPSTAFIYEKDSLTGQWVETAQLQPSLTGDLFGNSVSISGTTALVGDFSADTVSGTSAGAAYIFEKNPSTGEWLETARLEASDATAFDGFGVSVSISDNTALVGSTRKRNSLGEEVGAIYVFKRDASTGQWVEVGKLEGSDSRELDRFGISVSVSGTMATVGAYLDDGDMTANAGSVYVFSLDGFGNDFQAPVITLRGDTPEKIAVGEVYNDAGATAFDGIDGDVTDRIVVTGLPIDSSVPAVHTITYTVSDRAGNETSTTRTVKVLSPSDATAELIAAVGLLDLSDGEEASLVAPLEAVVEKLAIMDALSDIEAFELLNTFIQQVVEVEFNSGIDEGDARALRSEAKRIQVSIRGMDIVPVNENQKLFASNAVNDDRFGYQVASSGNIALISAREPQSVYVFEEDSTTQTWTERVQLEPSDAAAGNFFGGSIAISGTTAVIGDSGAKNTSGTGTGAVYIFEPDSSGNWREITKLLADDGQQDDRFGHVVALFEDTLLVTASGVDSAVGSFTGAAYIFERDRSTGEWIQTAKFTGSEPEELEEWGASAAVGKGIAVIGAPLSNGETGRADIFEKDVSTGEWRHTAKLVASDTFLDDARFGFSVSISNETVVITTFDVLPGAFVFEKDAGTGEWLQTAKPTVYDETSDGSVEIVGFNQVEIVGDRILGTAEISNSPEPNVNAVYVFEKDMSTGKWLPTTKLIKSDESELNNSIFDSLAISDGFVFAGAPNDNQQGILAGAVYVFEIDESNGPAEETLTFIPVADATIKEDFPTENFGAVREVETDNRPVQHFLMKFDISGVGDREVTSATLRLHCMDKSNKGGDFHETDNDWSEETVTWDNAPEPDPEPVASLGAVARRTWVELDLSSVITRDGTYSFRVVSPSRDGADYRSKEKRGREPELIITVR